MNYLKLNSNSSNIIKSIYKQPLGSINRLNNNNNNKFSFNNKNEEQKRSYSSFSMKGEGEPERPKSKFGFKSILALGLVIAAGSYLYYLRDNEDVLFSSKLPYQREEVEKFKTLMREMKRKQEELKDLPNHQSQKPKEEEEQTKDLPNHCQQQPKEEDEQQIKASDNSNNEKQETVSVIETPVSVEVEEENKHQDQQHKEEFNQVPQSLELENENKQEEADKLKEENNAEKKSNDGYGFSNSDSYDEINSEEADLDNAVNSDDNDDDSLGKEFLNIVNQEVLDHENKQEIPVQETKEELPKSEYITIIEEKKDGEQIKVDESTKETDGIVSEIIQDVLSLIPIKLNGHEKTEDIVKLLEKEYHDMAQALIDENGKLKDELIKLNLNKDEYLKSFEEYIKDKYKLALDATVDLLHGDLGEKLKDMDKYIQENVQENQKLVKDTLDRQKENLVNIFNQQSEAIKKSEVEKRAITQLTQLIVDIEKLLRDTSAQGKVVERSFKNLTDLQQYDELISQLLKTLPKDFNNNISSIINLEKLENEFKSISKEIRKVTLISPEDNSILGKVVSLVASKLILPEYGLVQGEHPDAYLSRTEEYLRRGDLTKAIKEMETLTENNKDLSKYTLKWLDAAKQRDQLENISKLLQLKLELIQKQQLEQQPQQPQQQEQ